MGPIVEDDIRGDGAEVFEESVSSASGGKGGAPGEDAQLGVNSHPNVTSVSRPIVPPLAVMEVAASENSARGAVKRNTPHRLGSTGQKKKSPTGLRRSK
jgi:hypothetical protein